MSVKLSPDRQGARVSAEVFLLTPSDIARGAAQLVDAEAAALAAWVPQDPEEQDTVRRVVRAALLRLLDSPHWMPSAVSIGSNRLDLHLAIDFDPEAERQQALTRSALEDQRRQARHNLRRLIASLGSDDGDVSTP